MLKPISKSRISFAVLLPVFLLQACVGIRRDVPATLPPVQGIESVPKEQGLSATVATITPAATEAQPTATFLPEVTVTAINGNLFIRRGPDMAYNPVGVLYKDTRANVIARDVLSDWVQIVIPDSEKTGWVSIQTEYSKVNGNLNTLPDFTPTEWPIPAYLTNCTQHEMYILPGQITLLSSLSYPENEIWLYPGTYTVYDLNLPDVPEVITVEIREGSDIEINEDGLGEHRKCP